MAYDAGELDLQARIDIRLRGHHPSGRHHAAGRLGRG